VTKLELETKHLGDFEDDYYEPQGEPLHVKVSYLLGKVALLWAERRRLFGWAVGSTVVTLALMFLLPNQYKAVAVLNPPDMNPMSGLSLMIGMKSGLASGLGSSMGDMLGLKSPGQIYLRQLQSRVVLDAMIRRFQLQKVYKKKKMEETRKILLGNSTFEEDKKSGVIEISVLDKDPVRAAQMANAYAEELGKLTADMDAQTGRLERQYFEAQLRQAKSDFRKASDELSMYGGQKGALNIEDEGKALADAVGAIEGQLIATKTELKGLQQIYTDNNVQVVQAKARINELTRQLAQMGSGSQGQSPKATSMPGTTPSSDLSIQHMWGVASPYMNLYGEMKIQEAVVQTLSEQYEIAKLQETHRISDIQVMDPAQPPEKKDKPHRATVAVIVGFFVFIFFCTQILIQDLWNRMAPDDPWKLILQPAVNAYQAKKAQRRWWKFWQWGTGGSSAPAAANLQPNGDAS
jgi:capsule polysaccharide export protein KpsE/RkpR